MTKAFGRRVQTKATAKKKRRPLPPGAASPRRLPLGEKSWQGGPATYKSSEGPAEGLLRASGKTTPTEWLEAKKARATSYWSEAARSIRGTPSPRSETAGALRPEKSVCKVRGSPKKSDLHGLSV